MTIVYEVYQGISAYRAMTLHAQVPECPRPMEGPIPTIWNCTGDRTLILSGERDLGLKQRKAPAGTSTCMPCAKRRVGMYADDLGASCLIYRTREEAYHNNSLLFKYRNECLLWKKLIWGYRYAYDDDFVYDGCCWGESDMMNEDSRKKKGESVSENPPITLP